MFISADGETILYLVSKSRQVAFRVTLVAEPPHDTGTRLVIWLQDVETKMQWQSNRLRACDFETAGSFLQKGTMEEYAQLFADSIRGRQASGRWSRPDDGIQDRVLKLSVTAHPRHFQFNLQPVKTVSTSQQLHAQAYELLLAHARELEKTLHTLKEARAAADATHSPPATSEDVAAPPMESPDTITPVESCVRAEIGLKGSPQAFMLSPIPSGAATQAFAVAEFHDGAKIVFRTGGKFLVSVSMGFYANQITVPKGATLFELQDATGLMLAVNKPTSGCAFTHIVPLVYIADVLEGDTLVLCQKDGAVVGGSVVVQTL